MKILHIVPGLGDGGAEAFLYRLLINSQDIKHYIISLSVDSKYKNKFEEKGIKVISLKIKKFNPISWFYCFKILKLNKRFKFSIIQGWLYHGSLLAAFVSLMNRNIPLIWSLHNTDLDFGKSSIVTIFIDKFLALISNFLNPHIIACADAVIKTHIKRGYKKNCFKLIYNGYDFSSFCPSQTISNNLFDLPSSPNTPILGMVARYNPYKDHINLLEALKLLSDRYSFYCLLVGTGMNKNNKLLTKKINDLNLKNKVFLCGSTKKVQDFMNYIDIHVLSSSAEAFPNVVIEAMACGTPCVATDVGDVKYILNDCGYLCHPKDSLKLSIAISRAIDDFKNKVFWNQICLKSRNSVFKRFSINICRKKYVKLWNDFYNA